MNIVMRDDIELNKWFSFDNSIPEDTYDDSIYTASKNRYGLYDYFVASFYDGVFYNAFGVPLTPTHWQYLPKLED